MAFVLGLKVMSPLNGKGELLCRFLEDIDRFGIGEHLEGGFGNGLKTAHQFRLDEASKKLQILTAVVEDHSDQFLDESLCHIHVVLKVVESHFRLHHPELGKMSAGIGILRPESGTEGIYFPEGQSINFGLKLTAHGEKGRPCKKIVPVCALALLIAGVSRIERSYAEDFSGSFTVACGNYRCMDIVKTEILKELVNCVAQPAANSCCRPYRVGPWPKVRDLPQILEGVPLFLQRIECRVGPAIQMDSFGPQLDALPFPRRRRHGPFGQNGAPCGD